MRRIKYEGADEVMDAVMKAMTDAGKDVSLEDVFSKRRLFRIVDARHMSVFIMRYHIDFTLLEIAHYFKRNHETVYHAAELFSDKVRWSRELHKIYRDALKNLGIKYKPKVTRRWGVRTPNTTSTITKDVSLLIKRKKKVVVPPPSSAPVVEPVPEDTYIEPVNYTKEEKKAIAEARRKGKFSKYY